MKSLIDEMRDEPWRTSAMAEYREPLRIRMVPPGTLALLEPMLADPSLRCRPLAELTQIAVGVLQGRASFEAAR